MGSYENDPGAGVVVVRKFNDEYKVLGLRLFGKYDLPKGKIDGDEDSITAAIRETKEEACITDLEFKWGMSSYQTGPVTIFLARDHHYNNKSFGKLAEGQRIYVKVIGQRFELNDSYISVIGMLSEADTIRRSSKMKSSTSSNSNKLKLEIAD